MSVRNLDALYKPTSVALIGASKRAGSIGSVIARNLLNSGFDGPILPVHPKHQSIEGVLAYPDIASLPLVPDLAIIATPPATVPGLVEQLGARGTRAVVVISAGFGTAKTPDGRSLKQALLDASKPHLLRIVGPNTLGILSPNHALNASFAHLSPDPGHLAFITQSGAVVTSVIDWAKARGIGFSHLVSLGDMADVDFGDMLDYLASDPNTTAILLYIEGIKHTRKFMSAARAASRVKPVIVVKAGRHPEGAKAAASHTGALAGADAVYDAAFRRAGMLRVTSLEQLFTATETLADVKRPRGDRLLILTNGGGMGVLATDELLLGGGRLAELSADTITALSHVLPEIWSKRNPVDIIGDATPQRLADAIRVLLDHTADFDALLILNCPTAVASSQDCAAAVVDCLRQHAPENFPLLTSWIGEQTARAGRDVLNAAGIATYDTPGHAVSAFMQLIDYERNQQLLMEVPASVPEAFNPDIGRVQRVLDRQPSGTEDVWLSEADAKEVLDAFGIPVVSTEVAGTPEEAGELATRLGGRIALKILSPDITHKSDVGGVMLDLQGGEAVTEAARHMESRIRDAFPDAVLAGFTVQPMVHRPGAHELIVGMHVDAQFGPVLLFGQGGTAVEVIADRALGLPPLNMRLAQDLIDRTRVVRLLRGYRNRPAADLEAIAMVMLRVSQLVVDFPQLASLDINPLLADERGVIALDARILLAAEPPFTDRLAIRPYPKALEETINMTDGRSFLLRPILPEDEPALVESFKHLRPEEIRFRFLSPMRTLTHQLAARLTQIDFDREMALVLTEPGRPGTTKIFGVVRLAADPDNEQAEFAIIVRHDMTHLGLGSKLMHSIIAYARSRGIGTLWGITLKDNRAMRQLARSLGFVETQDPDDPTQLRMQLPIISGETPS